MRGFRLSRRAVTFLEELLTLCERIGDMPLSFPAREDIAPGARMGVHGRYLILFEIDAEGVLIRRIIHGARRLRRFIDPEACLAGKKGMAA